MSNISQNVNIVEFRYYIWNRHEKCIQISTNMPSIGLVIPEITFEVLEFWKNNTIFHGKTMTACLVLRESC